MLTRSVRDVVQGADVGAPHYLPPFSGSFRDAVGRPARKLRIAVSSVPMLGRTVEPVVAAFADAAKLLKELGHEVFEAEPKIDAEPLTSSFLTGLAAELRVGRGFRRFHDRHGPAWTSILHWQTCSGAALPQAGSPRRNVLFRDP